MFEFIYRLFGEQRFDDNLFVNPPQVPMFNFEPQPFQRKMFNFHPEPTQVKMYNFYVPVKA